MVIAGATGGALYGAAAAALRVRLAVNETISTLLLNYLSVARRVLGVRSVEGSEQPRSAVDADLPGRGAALDVFRPRVHAGLLIGALLVLACYVALEKTRWGANLALLREGPCSPNARGSRSARQRSSCSRSAARRRVSPASSKRR